MLLWLAQREDILYYGGYMLLSDPNDGPMLASRNDPYGYIYVSY